jgi:hypothetical protein
MSRHDQMDFIFNVSLCKVEDENSMNFKYL